MTVDELRAGSTYKFKDEAPSFQMAPGQRLQYPANRTLHDWVITEPYNLIFLYKGHELKKNDLGGSNYLIAITTAPTSQKIVDHIQITFQSRASTLDEALVESKMLNNWFVKAGFRPHSYSDPEPGRVVSAFHIEAQERHAVPYEHKIASYQDARSAFLNTRSAIIGMTPFELETDDAYVGLKITNARRQREDAGADKDESSAATERTYFLDLSMSARPIQRYWNSVE